MFSKKITTLNIETNSIRVLVLNGKSIEWWGSAPLEPGTVRDGSILEQQALGQAIDGLIKGLKVPRDRMIVSLTGLHFTFRVLTVPKLKSDEMGAAIRRTAQKEMPLPLEELYLTWQLMGLKGGKQDVFVLGVPREPVDLVIKALTEVSIKPYIMDLKALALARVANRQESLVLDLESDNFGITLVAEGSPAIMRTFIPRRGDMILEDNVRRLAGEIVRTVEFYNRDHTENPIAPDLPVFLTGELADNPDTPAIVQDEIEYPITPIPIPFAHDTIFPAASFAVNAGLALRG